MLHIWLGTGGDRHSRADVCKAGSMRGRLKLGAGYSADLTLTCMTKLHARSPAFKQFGFGSTSGLEQIYQPCSDILRLGGPWLALPLGTQEVENPL
jgi:hypothetical protein